MAEVPDYVVRRPYRSQAFKAMTTAAKEVTFGVTLGASTKEFEQAMTNLGSSMLDASRGLQVLTDAMQGKLRDK